MFWSNWINMGGYSYKLGYGTSVNDPYGKEAKEKVGRDIFFFERANGILQQTTELTTKGLKNVKD